MVFFLGTIIKFIPPLSYPLFKLRQINMNIKLNRTCIDVILPQFVFHDGESFNPINSEECIIDEIVTQCRADEEGREDRRRSSVYNNASGPTYTSATAAPSAKRARYDNVYLSLMQGQLSFFKNYNYYFNYISSRLQRIEHFLNMNSSYIQL